MYAGRTNLIVLLPGCADMRQNLDLLEPHNLIPNGVWSFDDLLRYGEEHKQCPYFTARRMVNATKLLCSSGG